FKLAGPEKIKMTAASEDLPRRLVHVREALSLLFPVPAK
ncbi:MAG: hypothetical protein RL617_432, partial [Pseudomonadota bacterium]